MKNLFDGGSTFFTIYVNLLIEIIVTSGSVLEIMMVKVQLAKHENLKGGGIPKVQALFGMNAVLQKLEFYKTEGVVGS